MGHLVCIRGVRVSVLCTVYVSRIVTRCTKRCWAGRTRSQPQSNLIQAFRRRPHHFNSAMSSTKPRGSAAHSASAEEHSGWCEFNYCSRRTRKYMSSWFLHTERVHGRQYSYPGGKSSSSPSSRVQEAERKLQLVNDAQATEFTATMVTCRLCSTEVQLNETIPYQLDNWLAHKSSCPE